MEQNNEFKIKTHMLSIRKTFPTGLQGLMETLLLRTEISCNFIVGDVENQVLFSLQECWTSSVIRTFSAKPNQNTLIQGGIKGFFILSGRKHPQVQQNFGDAGKCLYTSPYDHQFLSIQPQSSLNPNPKKHNWGRKS